MKNEKIGVNIKLAQVFVLIISVVCIISLLIFFPLKIGLVISIGFLIISFFYFRLYSISIKNDSFIIENLFTKKNINKKECIGLTTDFKVPPIMCLHFKNDKRYRFMLDTSSYFLDVFSARGGNSLENKIFDKIQKFLDKS